MADFTADENGDGDILTSYSNPNYTFGIALSGPSPSCPRFASEGQDGNGNFSDSNSVGFTRKSMDDSGDSVISSPTTDSALASPNADDIGGVSAASRYDGLCAKMQRAVQLHQLDELEYQESCDIKPEDDSRLKADTETSDVKQAISHPNQSISETGDQSGGVVEVLPIGWQRHEDKDGPYYWHIKSGTIQRELPVSSPLSTESFVVNGGSTPAIQGSHVTTGVAVDGGSAASCQQTESKQLDSRGSPLTGEEQDEEAGLEYEVLSQEVTNKYPIRFAVRSLGWVPIAEEQLTQELSSRAVNQCIGKLSSGLRDVNDVVGRWGDGKYLYMDLDQENLSLIDPHDLTVLNVQPIRAIRVWGVGRDSGRDFAYVARDRATRQHMCHVFRCELPARHIANTLCEVCKKIIAQRAAKAVGQAPRARPTDLPNLQHSSAGGGDQLVDRSIRYENLLKNSSFPTPMEEPRKTINCHYLGTLSVTSATGVDVLNGAIDTLHSSVPVENWTYVSVTIAPSTITISEHEIPDNVIAECRVRFLSFLGISLKNVKLCAFIMHTAQDQFVAYVFHCEPSAGALCKTVEAACKLRYQKCLDKSLTMVDGLTSPTSQQTASSASKDSNSLELSDSPGPMDNTLQESTNRSSFWSKADSWRTVMSTSFATVKAGTVNKAVLLKESMQETASSVRSNAASSRVLLKDGLSNTASIAKTGLSTTLESLRKRTEVYFKRDS